MPLNSNRIMLVKLLLRKGFERFRHYTRSTFLELIEKLRLKKDLSDLVLPFEGQNLRYESVLFPMPNAKHFRV